ncbi:MAG: DNA-3-methyladenine glycosylase I [Chloroflexi bacterium]|nr:DNA-3-methyladenine glycosylase I [Chloroflexota bacterium]
MTQTPTSAPDRVRCPWAGDDPLMRDYHDREWGRPIHDDQRLFELLCLEGAQAGLAWHTILHRREGYRAAYEGFDAAGMASWDDARQAAVLQDPRIIRNRAKVAAFRDNARATLRVRDEHGSLDAYLWRFAPPPRATRLRDAAAVPAETPESVALSKDLRRRGFRFVGPVIVYAFMQSSGMVDDHLASCFVGGPGDPYPAA